VCFHFSFTCIFSVVFYAGERGDDLVKGKGGWEGKEEMGGESDLFQANCSKTCF